MNLLRWLFVAYIILGATIGIIIGFTGGVLWPDNALPIATADDPRYQPDTSHIQTYYRLLRAKHERPPKDWNKGAAGSDYCLNLGIWFMALQREISQGHERLLISDEFKEQLDYEVHMEYLKASDRERLELFIVMAPVGRPTERDLDLGNGVRDECVKELRVPA